MKIISRTDFLKLPEGILYSRYNPSDFTGLEIKKKTIFEMDDENSGDWFYKDLIGNVDALSSSLRDEILEAAEETCESFDLNFETYQRDGNYEVDEMYAVYEPRDIMALIEALQKLINLSWPTISLNSG